MVGNSAPHAFFELKLGKIPKGSKETQYILVIDDVRTQEVPNSTIVYFLLCSSLASLHF